ncbi:MAG TPA: hypothetical protein VNS09_02365 [Solirubrobacter sp.]|nr:hypothetical protein [Solirubrobacter sp.]
MRALREKIAGIRGEAMAAKKRVEAARQAFDRANHADKPVTEWQEFAEAQEAVAARQEVLDRLAEANAQAQLLAARLDGFGPIRTPLAMNHETVEFLRNLADTTMQVQNTGLGALLSLDQTIQLTGRALSAGPVTVPDPSVGRDGHFLGIVQPPSAQPTSLLDLFRTVEFEGRKASFLRRTGGIAAAGVQIEGTTKVEADITYEEVEVEALTVASWIKCDRQKLADIEGLQADMLLALRQGVLTQVEYLLLGTNPVSGGPAVGITQVGGIQTPDVSGLFLADAVGKAKAGLLATGVTANFVAAHPNTIEREASRTTEGSGEYVKTIADDGRIRELPLVPTVALAEGDVLVGDSRLGARLGVREPVSAAIGQEQDDMTRNRITSLVEGRWAIICDVPGAFSYFTLDPPEA